MIEDHCFGILACLACQPGQLARLVASSSSSLENKYKIIVKNLLQKNMMHIYT